VTVTDLARIGLAQLVNAEQMRLVPLRSYRDLPVFGSTLGHLQDVARAASRAACDSHVEAGRLEEEEPHPGGKR
jgi:hypothetical protein